MQNGNASNNKNITDKTTDNFKKAMRPQTQRLALEPRIVFDAALPIAIADFIDAHPSFEAPTTPAEQTVAFDSPFTAPAIEANKTQAERTTAAASIANKTELTEQSFVDGSLFNGTLIEGTLIEGTLFESTLIEGTLIKDTFAPANLSAKEIIFIDAIVADLQAYITNHPNADVVLLDSSKDALDQIAATLAGRTGIASVHILSHGTSGELQIGNGVLNLQNLNAGSHAADLAIIKSALTDNGDILIYGCNVAAGESGQAFIDALANYTGADIAASTDTTGAAEAYGGNWHLEKQTAVIEAKTLQLQDWQGQLVYSNTFAGGAWTFSATANTATVPVVASNTTDGITTTVTLASTTANAWSATAVQTLNNIAAFANGAAGTADFTTTFNTANTAGATGTVTITFSKPVLNPIIHIDRIGGIAAGTSNSSLWTLTTAGATLTKLNGTSSLLVGGASANGSTGTTIQRQTGVTTAGTESSLTAASGTAAGSMQVAGTYSTLTFTVTGPNDGLELAFAFDAPPTTNNDAFTTNANITLTTGNLFANNGSGADIPYADAVKVNTINGVAFTVNTPITLTNGTLTITDATTGAFTFAPNANYSGVQTFTYDVVEINTTGTPLPGTGVGNKSNTSTASITVVNVNNLPTAVNDVFYVKQGTAVIGELFKSNGFGPDTDLDGGTLSLTKINGLAFTVGTPIVLSNGVLTVTNAALGIVKFVANPNAAGPQTFTYEVADGQGGISTATVTVNINNTAPTINLNGNSNLLVNGSFESPVVGTINGNNIQAGNTFGGWTSSANGLINIIRVDGSPYAAGADTAADGNQYLDIAGANGAVFQSFTIAQAGLVNFGSEFSIREAVNGNATNLVGDVEILDANGIVVATSTTLTLLAVNGEASWYASKGSVNLAAGTYTYRITVGDNVNADNNYVHLAGNYATAYSENAAPISITAAGDSIADIDDANIESANIVLTNFKPGDTLSVIGTLPTGIVASAYNAATGVITLSGTGSRADYATAIKQIGFANSSNSPDTTTRTVNVTVNDGQINSNTAVTTITVTAVNDAPLGADNTITITEDTPYTVTAADFGFSDVDSNAFTNVIIGATLPPNAEGVYKLNGVAILPNQVITVADITAGKLTFSPAANANTTGAATLGALNFQVQDNGGTLNGGVNTDPIPNTLKFSVTPVTDVVTIGGLNDGSIGGTDAQVKESDLATGSTPVGTNETTGGNFNLGPDASLTSITLNGGVTITKAQLAAATAGSPITATGTNGTLSITGYNAVTGVVTYSYTLSSAANQPGNINVNDNFAIAATSVDGIVANGILGINILDDVPKPVADTDEAINIAGNPSSTASGNVFTGIGGTDPNNADGNKDAIGADSAVASPVTGVVAGTGAPTAANLGGTGITTALGNLVLNADGSYVYIPNYANPTVAALTPGATLTDTFTYEITDSDGDKATTTLTITIVGVPAIVGLGDGAVAGTDGSVLESDLAAGTNAVGTGEVLNGSFQIVSPAFPVAELRIGANVIPVAALLTAGTTPIIITGGSAGNGTLIINGYDTLTGVVNYTYTLNTAPTTGSPITDNFVVSIKDTASNVTPDKFLKIAIINDVPIATADIGAVAEDSGTPATGNVFTNDKIGADGVSTTPTGPVTGIIAGTGTPPTAGINTGVAGSYGTLNLQANGSYSYVLNNANAAVNALKVGQSLTETFTYKITDKDGDETSATLNITINGANDAPVANNDGPITTVANIATQGNVLVAGGGNVADTDVDGDTLTVTQFTVAGVTGTFTVGQTATIVGVGSLVINANGSYTFTPVATYDGPVPSATYTITDGTATSNAVLSFAAVPNTPPVANNDGPVITIPNTPATGSVLTNDTDADGDTLSVTQFVVNGTTFFAGNPATIAGVGTLVINTDGTFTFTPLAAYDGPVPSANYTITDGTATTSAVLSFAAVPNTLPATFADTNITPEDTPVNGNVLTNDNDADGDALSVTQFVVNGVTYIAGTPANIPGVGVVVIRADGTYTFSPALNFNGAVPQATVSVFDGTATATSTLNITVTPNNDAPVALPDLTSTPEELPVSGNVLTNDSDVDLGTTLSVSQFVINGTTFTAGTTATITGVGTLVINANGTYTFTPAPNFNGPVPQATYTVSDGSGTANGTTTSTLDVNVSAVNDPPIANDDNIVATEDTLLVLNLLGNDTDVDNDTLSIKSINGISLTPGFAQNIAVPNGVVTISAAGVISFKPAPNYNGPVTFDYEVQDGKGGVDTGTVNITVAAVNDPPIAVDDVIAATEDTPVVLNLVGNDTDLDNDTLTVKSINGVDLIPGTAQTINVPNGAVTVDATGVITFTPNANYNGPATFNYQVQDGNGGVDTGLVTLNIAADNDPPIATPVTPTGNEDATIAVNLAGTDVDGTVISVTVTSLPTATQGILTLANGTPVVAGAPLTPAQAAGLIFVPAPNFNGSVVIPFTVTDNQGATSAPATANITINPINDPPVAISASSNPQEDTPSTVSLVGTDIDGTITSVTVTTLPLASQGILTKADGTPVIAGVTLTVAEAASLIFNPTLNFNGLVNIPFTVKDNSGATSSPANFLVDVSDVNDAPIATPATINGTEDTPAPVNLTGTDIDGTVTKVTVTSLPSPTQGILVKADGTPVVAGAPLTAAEAAGLIFKPAPNFNGTVTIPFTVTDNSGELSTPANVIINIGAVNDAPIVAPETQTIDEDTIATGNVLTNDSDIEGASLSISQFIIPGVGTFAAGTTATINGVGTVTISATGAYTFTPVLNFNGAVPQITYSVSDGVNTTNSTLNLVVTPVNDPPVAFDVNSSVNEDTSIALNLTGSDIDGSVISVTVTTLPPSNQGILTKADGSPVLAGVPLTPTEAAGLIFVPAPNFNGTVVIPFTVTDNEGSNSAPANATISVIAVNDPPIATPIAPSGNEDTPIPVSLTGTDIEAPITSVTVTTLPPASQGILTKADGSPVVAGVPLTPIEAAGLIFVPAPNFNGAVVIPFTVTDNQGTISPFANASITVVPVNDPPVSIAASGNAVEDTPAPVRLVGTDVDGTIASVSVTTLPSAAQGILVKADGSPVIAGVPLTPTEAAGLIFKPALNFNGIVNIPFTVKDNSGAISAPANFTLDVGAVDDDPIAIPAVVNTPEDTPVAVNITGTDVEGPITAVTVVSLPLASQGILVKADGTLVLAGVPLTPAEAAGLTFKPAPNFNGTVAIPFTVTDSAGQISSPAATLTLNISPVNDPPVAIANSPSGNEDTPISINLTGTDVDGTIASITVTTLPLASQGVLTLANGTPVAPGQLLSPAQAASLIFVPARNFVGLVNIPFTVTDNSGATSLPANSVITVKDVVLPPTATPVVTGGTTEDKIPVNLGGTDSDGTISSITIKAIPPATQGVLTLADGTPVNAGKVLTPAQAASLIFKPNSVFNGTARILFTVTDDEGLESSIAGASIKVTEIGGLFEQLQTQAFNFNANGLDPALFALKSPVVGMGIPEDLFVSNSVRESQNVIAQNNAFGIFNVDTPTANALNNFTFDLKGLPQGMDPNLFVQNAVRGTAVTFEPALFVQNSVRQSQLESTARNIGVASYNSATPAVPDLFSPFEIGSPMSFKSIDIALPPVELSPIKTTNIDKNNELKNLDKQKTNKECIPLRTVQRDYTKPYQLVKKPMADRLKPASSFTQQLTQAKRKTTNNVFCKH